ncbi:MAG: hypothetical protein MAG794_01804 [Gammaproteobacteria bacterium]|nr:hypothetical protein [Gammaproteobacteria bacterium]
MDVCGQQFTPATLARIEATRVDEPGLSRRELKALGPIELIPVAQGDRGHNRIWRGLIERYHPLASGALCGAQIRYLVASAEHGWLGALGFSAPAWRVAARDRFIGWDDTSRQAHLQQVVANTRFVLLPHVQVPHLASHVLGRCLRRLASDWQARYGIRPALVETYVDPSRYRGTCYRASNWRYVGATQGRGRQDRGHEGREPVKAVYVYPLCRDWRARLGGRASPPAPAAGDWADQELGGVALGDRRLNRRLRTLARDVYAQPQAQLPQACGTRAKTKAAYRLLDHPKSRMQTLLHSHYAATGNPTLPPRPPTLYEAMRMVAALGGFLGRKGDGEPGAQTLWRGLQRLDDLTDMYRLLCYATGPPGVQHTCG